MKIQALMRGLSPGIAVAWLAVTACRPTLGVVESDRTVAPTVAPVVAEPAHVEIQAARNGGFFPVELPAGTLVPPPHEIAYTGKTIPLASCAVSIAPDASPTERTAAAEIAAQIVHLGGTATVTDRGDTSAPVVIVIGVGKDAPVLAGFPVVPPDRSEGFAVQSFPGADGAGTTVAIAAADRFGAFWAAQTLKQLMRKENGVPVLADATLRDWPDIPIRMSYRLFDKKPEELDFIVRWGRPNWAIYEPISWQSELVFDAAALKEKIALAHANGMRVIGDIGYPAAWKHYDRQAGGNVCPVDGFGVVEKLIEEMYAAGIDGLSFRFDDVNCYERLIAHFQTHESCARRFPTLASWQVYLLRRVLALNDRLGGKMLITCPSWYYTMDGRSDRLLKGYQELSPGFTIPSYLKEFGGYEGSERVRTYFCGFSRADRSRLAEYGVKNYAWWNNGPWSPDGNEVWRGFVSFATMEYSWYCYDPLSIDSSNANADFIERLDVANLDELRHLGDATDLVMHGTGDMVGLAIGHAYSWNPAVYLPKQPGIRVAVINNLFGKDVSAQVGIWEAKAKGLLRKYYRMEPLTAADIADVGALQEAHATFCALDNPLAASQVRKLSTFIGMIGRYKEYCEGVSAATATYPATIASPSASPLVVALDAATVAATGKPEFAIAEKPVAAVTYQGRPGLLFDKNKLTSHSPAFILSRTSFTVEAFVVPQNITYFKLAGTRESYRESYPKLPGWAVGCDMKDGKIRFTVEDTAHALDTVLSATAIERFKPCHIVAVRNWETKTLSLYLDGAKVGEVPETGSGDFGDGDKLMVSYDSWTGGYFQGVMHFMKVHAMAMTEPEVKAWHAKLTR
jgi:hypothetical protein